MAAANDKARKGIKARQDAIKALIVNHQDEFDAIHAKNRVALGLSPRSAGPSTKELEERIKKQEERLAKWKQELELSKP
jgi:hypothetical protein